MASTSFSKASSSSFSTLSMAAPKRYDVFLSFRGEDTRYTFTDHLYQALIKRGIRTFRDDEQLGRGEAIAPELLKAIEDSRSSIIVFSENYAHSRWCLDELVKIMECWEDVGHTVIPIFYHVDPAHVRKQAGNFGEAFADYEENWKDKVKVGRWRKALTQAGNLSGWHLKLDGYESNYIKKIIDPIFHKLNCQRFDINGNLVGMESRLKELHLLLNMESIDVRIVGVYGLGGIGKTTIAKAIYNKLSWEFEYMSFLENISEVFETKGVRPLQSQLLSDILREEGSESIKNDSHGAQLIQTILPFKRVFVVLDDVGHQDQLEYLIGSREWLGKGSRVIITTRDKRLLTIQEVDDSYKVKGLNSEEAFTLFSWYAFKQDYPELDFIGLSWRAISYCKGLPLALKVLGSLLFKKTKSEWESEFHKLESEPDAKIHKVLKRSYAGLDRTEKKILLDVACFFKGENRDFVSSILDGCDFCAARGIKNLNEKCLITLPNNKISMHDLIQQMSWEIVREEFPNEPNKWSRLWDPRDIDRALRANEGIHGVETLSWDLSKLERVRCNPNALAKMTKLRLLRVHSSVLSYSHFDDEGYSDFDDEGYSDFDDEGYSDFGDDYSDSDDGGLYDDMVENASKMKLGLDFEFSSYELRYLRWDGYPLESLPSNFDGENLIELHLKCSNIKRLWEGNKYLERLKVIDMSCSKKLIRMPDFSSMPNLEKLILMHCVSLIDIHPSVGVLKKLTTLSLSGCSSFAKFPEIQGKIRSLKKLYMVKTAIRELPNGIDLESVEILDLANCFDFEKFPENGANMKSLKKLRLYGTAVKELPTGIANWESLPMLDLSGCHKFERLPKNVGNMKSLKELCLINAAIKDLPDSIGELESLEILHFLGCSKIEKFPENIGNMKSLKNLWLSNAAIKDLPDSIGELESLEILGLRDCLKFEKLPKNVGNMKSLKTLRLQNTAIKDLPDGIGELESLEFLDLRDCLKLEKLPKNVGNMKSLKTLHLQNTAIKDLPDGIGELESLEFLDLSNCSKIEKFPEVKRRMNNLGQLYLRGTAIEELPSSIDNLCKLKGLPSSIINLESLVILNLSGCSSFAKFPEIQGKMRSLKKLYMDKTAIRELPNGIDLESVEILDLTDCFKFEKFPENGANMKSLKELRLNNTAVKELPTGIANWESLPMLDLSKCYKFERLPKNVGNMKSLKKLHLQSTAIKDLPDSIGELESLEILDLSNCSKIEKFPEVKRRMNNLRQLYLRGTAIEELPSSIDNLPRLLILDVAECKNLRSLPENISRLNCLWKLSLDGCSELWRGSILNLLSSLGKLNTNNYEMAGPIIELPSSLEGIHAHGCRSEEDVWSLLWYCHLNWLTSATTQRDLRKHRPFSAIIPESSGGIPEWIRYDNLGSEVTTELPMNWYKNPDFLGFVVSCVCQTSMPFLNVLFICQLNIHGNGFEFKNEYHSWYCHSPCKLNDPQLWVCWYPKIAILKEHHHNNLTHFTASFLEQGRKDNCVKKCGVNLVFVGDEDNHMPMLLEHLLGNSGDKGSVVVCEENNGNH